MTDYPTANDIRERLPYTAASLGFDDATYETILGDIRDEEIDRIEAWGDVINSQASADRLHDGTDPHVAFEEFAVENVVDGSRGVHAPRLVDEHIGKTRGDRYFERKERRLDDEIRRRRVLPLPGRPVVEVESVELVGRDIELVVDEDVYLERDSALELAEDAPIGEWPRERRSVRVNYTFGNDGVPGRVRASLVDLVHWRLINDESLMVDSESVEGDSVTYKSTEEILGDAFDAVSSETDESYHRGVMSL